MILMIKATIILFFYLKTLGISCLIYPIKPISLPNDPFIMNEPKIYESLPAVFPSINICIGIPRIQCFDLLVCTSVLMIYLEDSSSFTKHFNHQYNASLSSSVQKGVINMSKSFFNDFFFGNLSQEAVSVNDTSPPLPTTRLQIFLLDYSRMARKHPYDGYLGLTKDHDRERTQVENSFISYLYHSKQISHQNFAFKFKNEQEGYVEVDIDDKHKKDLPKCSTDIDHKIFYNHNYWVCYLNEVSIGNKSYKPAHKTGVEFNTLTSLITMPQESGFFIFEHVRNMAEGKCIFNYVYLHKVMICDDDTSIEAFPDILLQLEGAELKLKWVNLMKKGQYKNKTKYISTIAMIIENPYGPLLWTIGLPAFIDYEVIFDQDDETITFIYLPLKSPSRAVIVIRIMITAMLFLLLGTIHLVLRLDLKKKLSFYTP